MTNIEKLVSILVRPFQAVEAAFQDMLAFRSIEHGFGDMLDVIGRYVGQLRGGLSDTDYRRYLRARIATNRSTGKREDLIKVARLVLGTTDGTVWIRCQGRASAILEIYDLPVDDATRTALRLFVGDAAGIGIRVAVATTSRPIGEVYRFDTGPGLDNGHFSTSADRAD